MKLYINIDTGLATAKPTDTAAITRLDMKRGDTFELACVFHRAAVPVELPANAAGVFCVKEDRNYTSAPLLQADSWVKRPAPGDGYVFAFVVSGQRLTALLGGDKDSIPVMGEVTWQIGELVHKTPKIPITLANDIYRSDGPESPDPETVWPLPDAIALKTDVAAVQAQVDGKADLAAVQALGEQLGAAGAALSALDDGVNALNAQGQALAAGLAQVNGQVAATDAVLSLAVTLGTSYALCPTPRAVSTIPASALGGASWAPGHTLVHDNAGTLAVVVSPMPADAANLPATVDVATLCSSPGFYLSRNSAFAADAGGRYALDTSSAAFTVTLPADPAPGSTLRLADPQGTWGAAPPQLTTPDGTAIDGSPAPYSLNTPAAVTGIYVGGQKGWCIYA